MIDHTSPIEHANNGELRHRVHTGQLAEQPRKPCTETDHDARQRGRERQVVDEMAPPPDQPGRDGRDDEAMSEGLGAIPDLHHCHEGVAVPEHQPEHARYEDEEVQLACRRITDGGHARSKRVAGIECRTRLTHGESFRVHVACTFGMRRASA
jgi:hypothetical protein